MVDEGGVFFVRLFLFFCFVLVFESLTQESTYGCNVLRQEKDKDITSNC